MTKLKYRVRRFTDLDGKRIVIEIGPGRGSGNFLLDTAYVSVYPIRCRNRKMVSIRQILGAGSEEAHDDD